MKLIFNNFFFCRKKLLLKSEWSGQEGEKIENEEFFV